MKVDTRYKEILNKTNSLIHSKLYWRQAPRRVRPSVRAMLTGVKSHEKRARTHRYVSIVGRTAVISRVIPIE